MSRREVSVVVEMGEAGCKGKGKPGQSRNGWPLRYSPAE